MASETSETLFRVVQGLHAAAAAAGIPWSDVQEVVDGNACIPLPPNESDAALLENTRAAIHEMLSIGGGGNGGHSRSMYLVAALAALAGAAEGVTAPSQSCVSQLELAKALYPSNGWIEPEVNLAEDIQRLGNQYAKPKHLRMGEGRLPEAFRLWGVSAADPSAPTMEERKKLAFAMSQTESCINLAQAEFEEEKSRAMQEGTDIALKIATAAGNLETMTAAGVSAVSATMSAARHASAWWNDMRAVWGALAALLSAAGGASWFLKQTRRLETKCSQTEIKEAPTSTALVISDRGRESTRSAVVRVKRTRSRSRSRAPRGAAASGKRIRGGGNGTDDAALIAAVFGFVGGAAVVNNSATGGGGIHGGGGAEGGSCGVLGGIVSIIVVTVIVLSLAYFIVQLPTLATAALGAEKLNELWFIFKDNWDAILKAFRSWGLLTSLRGQSDTFMTWIKGKASNLFTFVINNVYANAAKELIVNRAWLAIPLGLQAPIYNDIKRVLWFIVGGGVWGSLKAAHLSARLILTPMHALCVYWTAATSWESKTEKAHAAAVSETEMKAKLCEVVTGVLAAGATGKDAVTIKPTPAERALAKRVVKEVKKEGAGDVLAIEDVKREKPGATKRTAPAKSTKRGLMLTPDQARAFKRDPTRNPLTGRAIKHGSATHASLERAAEVALARS